MDELQTLLAKQAITEVIYRYARAIDRMDEALLRSVFHPGSRHFHFYKGPSSDPDAPSTPEEPGDFVRFALGLLTTYARTHHHMTNVLIDFEDDSHANTETYFTAFHLVRPLGDPLAGAQAFDCEMDYFVGGRYIDRFEKRDGLWGIVDRTGMTDWVRIEPSATQGFNDIPKETVGAYAPDDLICRFYSV